jgi:3-oxoacyl-[acyl-carrier protein] reductase
MKDEDWDAVLTVNLKGAFLCTRAASKVMAKQRYGRIINIASIVGQMGNAGQANYCASKGLIGLTKSNARELAKRNARQCRCPGFIATDMTEVLPEKVKQNCRPRYPWNVSAAMTLPMRWSFPRSAGYITAGDRGERRHGIRWKRTFRNLR